MGVSSTQKVVHVRSRKSTEIVFYMKVVQGIVRLNLIPINIVDVVLFFQNVEPQVARF